MDADSVEGRDDERDVGLPGRRRVVQPQPPRQQSRDPVLGSHHHDIDYHNNVGDFHNCTDYNDSTRHHHHGPGDNNILIHDHKHALGIHNHLIDGRDIYGAAVHTHDDDSGTAGDRIRLDSVLADRVFVDGVGWHSPVSATDGPMTSDGTSKGEDLS